MGKSSILNALTGQCTSIVSSEAGTTTDPVLRAMELLPLGPVLFLDTAGLDDEGELGLKRVERSLKIIERTDVAILVTEGVHWGSYEMNLAMKMQHLDIPLIVVFNKMDRGGPPLDASAWLHKRQIPHVLTTAVTGEGIGELRTLLMRTAPPGWVDNLAIVSDLVSAGDILVLVTPQDREAPRGRLILPQVQTIRDLLDHKVSCVVTLPQTLEDVLGRLGESPRMVITDSQALREVAAVTPPQIPLTSFSVLFSRFKGDLVEQMKGTLCLDHLPVGASVLVAEACNHHPISDDIGTVKIPRWLTSHLGHDVEFVHVRGHDFPVDLSPFSVVIHCGACMWNRREMLTRIFMCCQAGVPITNYGLTIAHSMDLLSRVLEPFPEVQHLLGITSGKNTSRTHLWNEPGEA